MGTDQEKRLPFRQLTPSNWAEPDPILQHLVLIRPDGSQSPVSGSGLAEGFLDFQLNEAVPRSIRAMFEVARGTMCYGFFFYPLYTLGTEQLYRVAEAGIRHRCGGKKRAKLADLIDQLVAEGVVPEDQRSRLDALRLLRNYSSHPEDQTILLPGDARNTVERVGELLNALFPDSAT